MKKLFVCMVVLAAVFAVASGADAQVKFRGFTALTGGGTGALDKIPVAELTDGDIGFVATTDYFYVYKFDAAATDAESTPEAGYQYIRPDDYATAGVWMQIGLYGVAMQSGPSTSPGISFYDSDATDGDINAKFYVNCTDAGSGSEDCDFYIQVQIAGTLTTIIQIDADGNVIYTHPVLMSGDTKLYFRDSAIYLYSGSDGNITLSADTGINLLIDDEDLRITKTGSNGITIGSNTGVDTITTALNITTTGILRGKLATVVNSDTTPYSVTQAQVQAGTLFITTNAATTTYVLPGAEAGAVACFRMGQGNAQVLRIDTDGTDYIVMSTGARTSAAGDYYGATSSASNKICVVAYDATDWYVESTIGTWTEE